MSIIRIQKPFERCLYWLLIIIASLAFNRAFDVFFYSLGGGTWQYNLVRVSLGLIFLFVFAEVVNRKIVIKHSKIIKEDKDEQ